MLKVLEYWFWIGFDNAKLRALLADNAFSCEARLETKF